MKSIMEEASSLAKAFAQAWEHAGKPQECTVKILAEPEKNFLGMTTKSAKIALFFNEPPAHSFGAKKSSSQGAATQQPKRAPRQPQETSQRQPQQRRQQERPRTQEARPERQTVEHQLEIPTQKTEQAPRIRPVWTDEMNQAAQSWIKESLAIMSSDASFETTMSRSILTISFNKPIIDDVEKEKLLFRSWAHLIVQHIKQDFKVHGKELKIILKGSRN